MNRRVSVILILLAMFGAACSSASTGNDVATTQDGATSSPSEADTAGDAPGTDDAAEESGDSGSSDEPEATGGAVEDGATPMAEESPLGAFFADDGGFEAAIAEYTVQVQESILVCMAAQGFEFAVSGANTNEVQARQNDLTQREWTAEFGYGISSSFDSIAGTQASDPNVTIFFNLSDSEREPWAFTLNGVGIAGLTGGGGGPVANDRPLEEQGCIGQAIIETGGQDALEGLGDFGDIYDEGEQALFERREMIEVITAWSRCMSEAGFQFAGLDDPEDEVSERLEVITAPILPALGALSEEEGQAFFNGETIDAEKLPGLDIDALRELQKYEIDLALVDLDCYDAEVRDVYEPLRDDFERGLLEEYSDEFTAIRNLGS